MWSPAAGAALVHGTLGGEAAGTQPGEYFQEEAETLAPLWAFVNDLSVAGINVINDHI